MSIADRDKFGSHFHITFRPNQQLDRNNVVFGKLIQGKEILKKIERVGDEEGKPTVSVKIIRCGEYSGGTNLLLLVSTT
jgi:peptidylprolyl isomerase/peptidyl-prolyl isomerase G (cyclophilin G)